MTRLPHKTGIISACESISTQVDDFGERLEAMVTILVDEITASQEAHPKLSTHHPVIEKIAGLIYDRLGMKVDLVTNEHLAAIFPFYANKNHVFLVDFLRGNISDREQNKIIRQINEKTGTVNLQTAKLTGIFSEYEHPLYINFVALVKMYDMTAAEITAVMLHELGHGFYCCYYSARMDQTNQVLASIWRNLTGTEHGDLEYIYKELKDITPDVKKEEIDRVLNGNRVVAGAAWFKIAVQIVKSQMLNDKYDETGFEQRADNFAARFGYGKPLVLSLDKLFHGSPEKSTAILTFVQILNAAFTLGMIAMIFLVLIPPLAITGIYFAFLSWFILLLNKEDNQSYTYDKLKQRYVRLRQDLIDQLKNTKLHRDKVKELLDGVYAMDESIKETRNVNLFSNRLANLLWRAGAKKILTSVEDQQLMEALASNDLFLRAAELQQQA